MKRERSTTKRMRKEIVKQVEESAETPVEDLIDDFSKGLIHSGSVMLNLACSDRWNGGYGRGKMTNVVGDSSAGKTALALIHLAHCANNPDFDDYELIFDDVESALEFDIKKLCGEKAFNRIKAPAYDEEGEPVYSDTIQEWHNRIEKLLDSGQQFIYVLDSFDALTSREELLKYDKNKKEEEAGRKTKGSYGDGKPKEMSKIGRMIKKRLKDSNSHVLVISQTRDKLDAMMFEEKKIRSGGNALRFYACHEVWLAVKEKLKEKNRQVGALVRIRIKKNKMTGKIRQVEVPLFYDYGIDDIGSCIDFLLEEKVWRERKGEIIPDIKGIPAGKRDNIIKVIENKGLEKELFKRTEQAWLEVEDSLKLNRKPKFA